ncbi:MAG: hypothetical protein M0Z71_05475 [Nitrospiraceae bacterium]|nr:hypothetical protein [Nitrospiraceae bacterium]
MSERERDRPLPEPETSAFGRRKRFEDEEKSPLMADDIARAAAEGRLEELFGEKIPDGEYSRALVSMLMGMTGISSFAKPSDNAEASAAGNSSGSVPHPPEEVLKAVRDGDVSGLMGLLRSEHMKRSPGDEGPEVPDSAAGPKKSDIAPQPTIGKDVIDGLIGIASDNGVSLDWLILRALKMYVRGYLETGRL